MTSDSQATKVPPPPPLPDSSSDPRSGPNEPGLGGTDNDPSTTSSSSSYRPRHPGEYSYNYPNWRPPPRYGENRPDYRPTTHHQGRHASRPPSNHHSHRSSNYSWTPPDYPPPYSEYYAHHAPDATKHPHAHSYSRANSYNPYPYGPWDEPPPQPLPPVVYPDDDLSTPPPPPLPSSSSSSSYHRHASFRYWAETTTAPLDVDDDVPPSPPPPLRFGTATSSSLMSGHPFASAETPTRNNYHWNSSSRSRPFRPMDLDVVAGQRPYPHHPNAPAMPPSNGSPNLMATGTTYDTMVGVEEGGSNSHSTSTIIPPSTEKEGTTTGSNTSNARGVFYSDKTPIRNNDHHHWRRKHHGDGYYNDADDDSPSSLLLRPFIFDLNPYDVLCGRGVPTYTEHGNKFFKELVKQHQVEYISCRRTEKPPIATHVIEIIRSHGGRFLRRVKVPTPPRRRLSSTDGDRDHDLALPLFGWVELAENRIYEKVCQALRDGAPRIRQRMLELEGKTGEGKVAATTSATSTASPSTGTTTTTMVVLPTPDKENMENK